jgi:hypothetical protein
MKLFVRHPDIIFVQHLTFTVTDRASSILAFGADHALAFWINDPAGAIASRAVRMLLSGAVTMFARFAHEAFLNWLARVVNRLFRLVTPLWRTNLVMNFPV